MFRPNYPSYVQSASHIPYLLINNVISISSDNTPLHMNINFPIPHYTGCFKKSFTTLEAYRNLYRGHTQSFELSKCSKTHRVLPWIVIRNCFDLFFRFFLHGTSTVTVHRPGKRVLRYSRTSPR
jgi:hypothetical protein